MAPYTKIKVIRTGVVAVACSSLMISATASYVEDAATAKLVDCSGLCDAECAIKHYIQVDLRQLHRLGRLSSNDNRRKCNAPPKNC